MTNYQKWIVILASYFISVKAFGIRECREKNSISRSCTIENFNMSSGDSFDSDKQNFINELTFVNSEMDTIPAQIISKLFKLEILNVSNCQIKQIKNGTELITSAGLIDLSRNHIVEIPVNAFQGARNLFAIDLSYNLIITIDPDAFNGLSKLEKLILTCNRLTALDFINFSRNFRALHINDNALEKLIISQNVFVLNADNNFLKTDTVFVYNSSLRHLSLKNNSIDDFAVIKNYKNLTFLDLSLNPIKIATQLTSPFKNLKKLDTLILKSTNLYKFDFVYLFSNLPSLRTLDISDNHFNFINFNSLSESNDLEYLNLNNNNLSGMSLNNELDYLLPNLKSIGISENNWKCPDLIAMLTKLKQFKIKLIGNSVHFIGGLERITTIRGIRCENITSPIQGERQPGYVNSLTQTMREMQDDQQISSQLTHQATGNISNKIVHMQADITTLFIETQIIMVVVIILASAVILGVVVMSINRSKKKHIQPTFQDGEDGSFVFIRCTLNNSHN